MDFGPGVAELSSLTSTEDSALLDNTRKRYDAGHIYTRSGRLLLAVNPYRPLPLYTEELLHQYKNSLQPQAELAPHVYAVAASAHMGMMQNSKSQSVIISGESGAGKTETAKILLQYLAAVSSSAGSDLHVRVLQTNPIMESFGCAKTVWNNNSSRFGKFLTLQFNATGRMQGAFMKTYLLEKSRITSQLAGEQNYHVLYIVAQGLPEATKKEWGIPLAVQDISYLNCTKDSVIWEQFPASFQQLESAMDAIPSLKGEQKTCWRVLMGVLMLGNAKFKAGSDPDADAELVDTAAMSAAAVLLGCKPEDLIKYICSQMIKAGFDWISKPNSVSYAQNVKNALARALYSKLFDFIVNTINSALIYGGESRYFIGAVDIFGFECFPTNSLEQLCINFANEKLQRMFTEAVFESVIAEYTKEGIDVAGMNYEDNSKVVELIDGQGNGVLPLLSEECFFPAGSDASYLGKLKQAHAKHPHFAEERMDKNAFTIVHYPGKVTYDSRGFLEKNKDPLSQDLTVLMQCSDDPFVAELFKEKQEAMVAGSSGVRRFKSAKFVGVIDAFRTSLSQLVSTLKETKTHFIRCVKPNMVKQPHKFMDDVMMRQLYTSGVVQAVQATRKGFPDHLLFAEVLGRFIHIVPKGSKAAGKEGCQELLISAGVKPEQFRLGKTKAFLGVGVLDELEKRRMEFIAKRVGTMQAAARMIVAKQKLRALREEKRRAEEAKRKAEEEKRRKEEEERKLREAEEAKQREEEAKKKEAEEVDRQKRFQRARQLSFERRTARKKREDDETKKAREEAEAEAAEQEAMKGAVAKRKEELSKRASGETVSDEAQPSEQYAKKLEQFQQEVADGTVTSNEMINVAVVSDIGWKNAGGEAAQEDVWAQYDFKCAVSDVLEYAEYLGMDIKEDAHLLWIADEALQAPEPQGWEQRLDPKGGVYYYHPTTGMSLNQHPLDHHYQQFYLQMKAQYDAMYAQKGDASAEAPAPAAAREESSASYEPQYVTPLPEAAEEPRASKGIFSGVKGLFRPSSAKATGATEDMYELAVDLQRQQDGLGIGLTLDNIIVEVEPGGSVHAQGELQYGDQIIAVDGHALNGRMLKDVIVPRRTHMLVVRYTRMSNQQLSPRRARARKLQQQQTGNTPRRIEELDVVISREAGTGRLGFGIDTMNTVVEVDPNGPVAGKLKVGDKIVAVDDALLNFKRFVDVIDSSPTHKLRVARLRAAAAAAAAPSSSKGHREKLFATSKAKKQSLSGASPVTGHVAKPGPAEAPQQRQSRNEPRHMGMPALREVRLVKETDETKIGAVFHRSDDAFDKSFFNVEGSSVQPIIKKVDPGSMAELSGLVPGDVVLSVNGISGLSNFQVVEMLRKGQGVFNLVVISGRQVQQTINQQGGR